MSEIIDDFCGWCGEFLLECECPKVEDKYAFYDTAEECAKNAEPLFAENKWSWHTVGVPEYEDLFGKLKELQSDCVGDTIASQTGGLIYNGKFGHRKY